MNLAIFAVVLIPAIGVGILPQNVQRQLFDALGHGSNDGPAAGMPSVIPPGRDLSLDLPIDEVREAGRNP